MSSEILFGIERWLHEKPQKRLGIKLAEMLVVKRCITCGMELLPYRKTVKRHNSKTGKSWLTTETITPRTYCDHTCRQFYTRASQKLSPRESVN